jgi:histidinol dehydrogenase
MLAQCEHDKDARAFLLCSSIEFAQEVDKKAKEYLASLQTRDIAEISYEKSIAVIFNSIDEAIELSNKKAPEHLELCLNNVDNYVDKFTNYGSLFIEIIALKFLVIMYQEQTTHFQLTKLQNIQVV